MSGLDFLYAVDPQEQGRFGVNWVGPATLEHGEVTLIASYPERPDGQAVDVYCTAMPARFYKLVAKTTGHTITTGSGCASWVSATAELVSTGMVGFN